MQELIKLEHIDYSYINSIPALTDINLSISKGEMFAIIGQNGSGKTTLLHILNALVFPEHGTFTYQGQEINARSMAQKETSIALRKSMGYIFQHPEMQLFCPSVMDELVFGPLQLNFTKEEAIDRATQIMKAMSISHIKERSVSMLSGGEKKKVAIASVLTLNPDVLLIDEPLAGIDPKTQTFLTELLIDLNRAGKTIIFTTHHLDLIDHLQPRVAVISENHSIQKIGSAAEILNDREFLIDVNLIHEHIHKHGEEAHKHYHSHYVFHQH